MRFGEGSSGWVMVGNAGGSARGIGFPPDTGGLESSQYPPVLTPILTKGTTNAISGMYFACSQSSWHPRRGAAARLFRWHAALFPTGRSGMETIRVGKWRDDAQGPMQVVSGPVHRRNVRYEAPPAARLKVETKRFIEWANGATGEPALIKSGIAHLWFATLHPFDDGNGRIACAVGDLFLARADGSAQRFYSVSGEIARSRAACYDILERTQKGTLDATEWLAWFLETLRHAIERAQSSLDGVLSTARFRQRRAGTPMNERQAKLVNRLLDGFDGRLTSSRWATIAGCSADTALRDITELIGHGLLRRMPGGGRSTACEVVDLRTSGET